MNFFMRVILFRVISMGLEGIVNRMVLIFTVIGNLIKRLSIFYIMMRSSISLLFTNIRKVKIIMSNNNKMRLKMIMYLLMRLWIKLI